jgi:hypothetical protein
VTHLVGRQTAHRRPPSAPLDPKCADTSSTSNDRRWSIIKICTTERAISPEVRNTENSRSEAAARGDTHVGSHQAVIRRQYDSIHNYY